MNEFEIVTAIDCPVATVFAALHDFDHFPDWNSAVVEVRRSAGWLLRVGSTQVFVGKFLGRSYESPSECTEYVGIREAHTRTTSGPFHLEIESSLIPTETGTMLTTVYRGESRGFFKLAEPVVIRLARKQFEGAHENFKALLEADSL